MTESTYRRAMYLALLAFALYQIYTVRELLAVFIIFGPLLIIGAIVAVMIYSFQAYWNKVVDRYFKRKGDL